MTPRPSCTTGTAASCTSPPTSSNRSGTRCTTARTSTSERRARHEDARSPDHVAAGGRLRGGRRRRSQIGPGREALPRDAPDVAVMPSAPIGGGHVNDDDGTEPATHLEAEPQSERGAPGSRDTGSDEPAGGPVDRRAGASDEDSDTTVDAQGAQHPESPDLPTGDQAG